MYQYQLTQIMDGEKKTELVFSSQHYTTAGFKRVVKEAVRLLKEDGIELPAKKKMEMIKRELINNHEFVSVTNNKIDFDITDL